MSETLDPIGARDVIRAIKALAVAASKHETPERISVLAAQVLEAFEALDLCPSSEKPFAKLGARLLNTGQAFVRGEGEKRDAQEVLIMGDMAMELADALYAYAEEKLKGGD